MNTYTYDMETVKYFCPLNARFTVICPACGSVHEIDAGDDFIEYPQPEQHRDLQCQCGHLWAVTVKIRMWADVEVIR